MNLMKRVVVLGAIGSVAAIGLVAQGQPAQAAEYPDKPIKLLVGFSAGGGTDSSARAFASFIHEADGMNGMPGIVVNKPGGTGMIAAKVVKDSRPDGYTLYVINAATFGITHMKSYGKAPVDPLKDFQILGCMSQLITSLQVSSDSPIKTANEFAKWAQENNGKLRWSNSGRGSLHTLAGMLFLKRLGVKAQDIPFKGGSKARNALVAKKVDFAFNGIHLTAGFRSQIRILGVTSAQRDKVHPEIPTLGEQNLPELGILGPMCLWGSKDLPANVVAKLKNAVKQVSETKGFKRILGKAKLLAIYRTPEEGTAATNKLLTDLRPIVDEIFAKK